jgi:prevent-host-death family protein
VFDLEQVNIHAAKTHLSALVEKAAAGEPFIIAKAGRPLVVVSPFEKPKPPSRIGFLKGQISVPEDFNQMGKTEIAALFEDER